MRPTFCGLVSRGIMESLKTIENSAAMEARIMQMIGRMSGEPGAANQRKKRLTILMTAKKAIHGFLAPDWSAMEPRMGEKRAMMIDDTVAMLLHVACAEIGSSVRRATK